MIDANDKIKTPIESLNIAGVGGLEFGSISELWGRPKSGKSTFAYQCAMYFLEDFKDKARVLILDSEGVGNLRLDKVFNLRPGIILKKNGDERKDGAGDKRVTLASAMAVESATLYAERAMAECEKNDNYLIVIWDSITASQPKVDREEKERAIKEGDDAQKYKAGMMLKPRVVTDTMNSLLQSIWQTKCHIFIVNQARASMNAYCPGEESPGPYAFKHALHYRFNFKFKTILNESEISKKGTKSILTINKSKHMPSLNNIPLFIYDDVGGLFKPEEEVIAVMNNLSFIVTHGGWYRFSDALKKENKKSAFITKSFRWKDLVDNEEIIEFSKNELKKYFRTNFKLVDWGYEELEEQKTRRKKE